MNAGMVSNQKTIDSNTLVQHVKEHELLPLQLPSGFLVTSVLFKPRISFHHLLYFMYSAEAL